MRLLENALLEQAPEHLEAVRELTVRLDDRNRPEPDIVVVPVDADTGPGQTWFGPEDVLLAVEVVSAESTERDRETKPRKYARAGIPHYWRVEESYGVPVVYAFEIDPAAHEYVPVGVFHDRLKLSVPFPIDIDLTAVNKRR
jgi:Uma2 family endonuclease